MVAGKPHRYPHCHFQLEILREPVLIHLLCGAVNRSLSMRLLWNPIHSHIVDITYRTPL